MNNRTLVSICCITYNHGPYIRACLDGFVMQKTNFDFEVLINDDCSTDGTTDIIKEYAAKYPTIIKPIFHAENQYSKGIRRILATFVFPRAKGKYIALCEGDDYWTDQYKLEKQVAFLESNPDYGLVYTGAHVLHERTKEISINNSCQQDYVSLLVNEDRIITLTTCFRKDLLDNYCRDITCSSQWLMGDLPWWLYFSYFSKIKWLSDLTGVYRFLDNSASHSTDIKKKIKFSLSAFSCRKYFDERFSQGKFSKLIATFEFNDLCKISVCYNTAIFGTLFKFAKENSLLSLKNMIKMVFYSTKIGREFHNQKYGNTIL